MADSPTLKLLREVYDGPAWHGPSVKEAEEAVDSATEAQLARVPHGATHSVADQLLGMAVHDGYHAGQIRQLALQFR